MEEATFELGLDIWVDRDEWACVVEMLIYGCVKKMFAWDALSAHHCVGIGIAEVTGVLRFPLPSPTVQPTSWRGNKVEGGCGLLGCLSAMECGLDSGAAAPNERFANRAVIQMPVLRHLHLFQIYQVSCFLLFSPHTRR